VFSDDAEDAAPRREEKDEKDAPEADLTLPQGTGVYSTCMGFVEKSLRLRSTFCQRLNTHL